MALVVRSSVFGCVRSAFWGAVWLEYRGVVGEEKRSKETVAQRRCVVFLLLFFFRFIDCLFSIIYLFPSLNY